MPHAETAARGGAAPAAFGFALPRDAVKALNLCVCLPSAAGARLHPWRGAFFHAPAASPPRGVCRGLLPRRPRARGEDRRAPGLGGTPHRRPLSCSPRRCACGRLAGGRGGRRRAGGVGRRWATAECTVCSGRMGGGGSGRMGRGCLAFQTPVSAAKAPSRGYQWACSAATTEAGVGIRTPPTSRALYKRWPGRHGWMRHSTQASPTDRAETFPLTAGACIVDAAALQ